MLRFAVFFLFVICEGQILRKEAYATVPQLITQAGYPVEKHRAKTSDGYILQLHRIPAGRRTARRTEPSEKGKKAVLLVHGLLGSSGDFVIMGPDRSLAFTLADAGYDVWLGNLRGNVHTAHQTLSRNNPKFWDFSFHEHGKYDAPAMIDKILNTTKLEKILYIGYSMGTTTFFTMMAQRPEYNEKIMSFVALAPAVYLGSIKPLVSMLINSMDLVNSLRSRGVMYANFNRDVLEFLAGRVCTVRRADQDVCLRFVYSLVGEDYEQNDFDMFPVIIARIQPASWRQLEHFAKISLTGVFTSWEDGLFGKVKPYNLTNVKVPVSIFYGENDQLTEKSNIKRLAKELNRTNVLEALTPVSWSKFNHLDFTFAKDVYKILNKPLVVYIDNLFSKYYL